MSKPFNKIFHDNSIILHKKKIVPKKKPKKCPKVPKTRGRGAPWWPKSNFDLIPLIGLIIYTYVWIFMKIWEVLFFDGSGRRKLTLVKNTREISGGGRFMCLWFCGGMCLWVCGSLDVWVCRYVGVCFCGSVWGRVVHVLWVTWAHLCKNGSKNKKIFNFPKNWPIGVYLKANKGY